MAIGTATTYAPLFRLAAQRCRFSPDVRAPSWLGTIAQMAHSGEDLLPQIKQGKPIA